MKKIIFPIVAIAILSLASCQKDRTCSCTETRTVNGVGNSSSWEQTEGHITKKELKRVTNCYSYTEKKTETIAGTIYNIESKRECELK